MSTAVMASAVCTRCCKPFSLTANEAQTKKPHKHCESCREKCRKKDERRRKRLKAAGRCQCGTDIEDESFNHSRGQKYKTCNQCREKQADYRSTEFGAFTQMVGSAKQRSDQRRARLKAQGKDFPGTCTITAEQAQQMFREQKGRCAISELPLKLIPGDWQASLNRLDDFWDYTDNSHITALEFNTSAHWTKEKLEAMPLLRRALTFEEISERVTWLAERPRRIQAKAQKDEETGRWLCFWCHEWCQAEQMAFRTQTQCKRCQAKRASATIRTELQSLLNSGRGNTKRRNLVIVKRSQEENATECMTVDIDLNFLIELLKTQEFRCAYSGVPLLFPCIEGGIEKCEELYRMSLERFDVFKGYTKDNVCLIGRGFQGADFTRARKIAVQGSGGWSKAKVDDVVKWLQDREVCTAPTTQQSDTGNM